MRRRVPGDVRETLFGRLQVAGGPPDDDGELDLPVRLAAAARHEHRVIGPDDGVGGLEEQDRLGGDLRPRLGGVVVVVQPDADDLADPAEGRADPQPRGVQGGQDAGRGGGGPYPGECGGVGEQVAVDVGNDPRQITQCPVAIEKCGALGARRTDSKQLQRSSSSWSRCGVLRRCAADAGRG